MKLTEECAKDTLDAVQHALDGHGPASITLSHPVTDEPAVVVFVIPAPVGPLVNRFLSDLYMMLGWHAERHDQREVH